MKYFNNKSWSQISREERFFCAELFFKIRSNPKPFLAFLGKKSENYEIAYEVCLYRDLIKANGESIKEASLPQKRTFDLALFSEQEIVIIEAKANTGFIKDQLDSVENDKTNIARLFKLIGHKPPKISTIAVYSSKYSPKKQTIKYFDKVITWKDLAEMYPDKKELFISANESYND